jgi:glycosyltransferase involved in cell wall biosynthesis
MEVLDLLFQGESAPQCYPDFGTSVQKAVSGMISVLLNDNIRWHHKQRGIARYFRHVAEAAVREYGRRVMVCSPEASSYAGCSQVPTPRLPGAGLLDLQDRMANLVAAAVRPRFVYSPNYGVTWKRTPSVVTVHDTIMERCPEYYSPSRSAIRRLLGKKRRSIERADLILSVSQQTADELQVIYPSVRASRIRVTPLGAERVFFDAGVTAVDPERYLLFVGDRSGYKNFARLLDAFAKSRLVSRGYRLRVVSGVPFDARERELIGTRQLAGTVNLVSGLSDTGLAQQYAGAAAFVFPSLAEGFGIPTVEAMAAGAPVLLSDIPIMREVAGDCGCYFDPARSESLAAALDSVDAWSASERASRVLAGRKRAASLRWEFCEQASVEAFRQYA